MGTSYLVGGLNDQSLDISANGEALYIATLDVNDSNLPKLLSMPSTLGVSTVEYDPQAGDRINVKGGRETDFVYAAGDFGSDKIVKYSSNEGSYWVDIRNGNYFIGDLEPIEIGPGNDYQVMVAENDQYNLWETYFVGTDGPYWVELDNTNTPFRIHSMDRLEVNDDEIIIGAYFYNEIPGDPIEYSPNRAWLFASVSSTLNNIMFEVSSVIYGIYTQ